MTHDDYTGETLKRCDECNERTWHDRDGRCPRCHSTDECQNVTPTEGAER